MNYSMSFCCCTFLFISVYSTGFVILYDFVTGLLKETTSIQLSVALYVVSKEIGHYGQPVFLDPVYTVPTGDHMMSRMAFMGAKQPVTQWISCQYFQMCWRLDVGVALVCQSDSTWYQTDPKSTCNQNNLTRLGNKRPTFDFQSTSDMMLLISKISSRGHPNLLRVITSFHVFRSSYVDCSNQ